MGLLALIVQIVQVVHGGRDCRLEKYNADFGQDFYNLTNVDSLSQCQDTCESERRCFGFTWGDGDKTRPPVNHANGSARSVHPVARPAQPAAKPAQPVAAYVQNGLVEHPNGAVVPAEPAEVVTAKREHLQLASVPIAYILEDNLFVYPNGVIVPAEGEANMAARRAHLAALANA